MKKFNVGDIVWKKDKTYGGEPEKVKISKVDEPVNHSVQYLQYEDMKGVIGAYRESSQHFYSSEKECLMACLQSCANEQKDHQKELEDLLEAVKERKRVIQYNKRLEKKLQKQMSKK